MPNGILRQIPLHLRSLGLAVAAAAVVLLSRLAIAETIAPSFKSPIRLTVTRPPFVHLGSGSRLIHIKRRIKAIGWPERETKSDTSQGVSCWDGRRMTEV